MNIKKCLLAAALGVALSGSVSAASMTAAEAEDLLLRRGFTNISMMEYENGLWLATGTSPSGEVVDIRVDPVDQKVTSARNTRTKTTVTTTTTTTRAPAPVVVEEVPVVVERPVVVEKVVEVPVTRRPIIVEERVLVPAGGKISKDDVRAVLAGSGYHNIHDIDWLSHRGVWKAEARDPYGDDREIHLDPLDGTIVHVEDD
ncbi:MAG TPA: hypothetical protein VFO79_00440 [Xanthomonadales bacterium]|nr:hypothetical protein [Xanthomonadales bacterium]